MSEISFPPLEEADETGLLAIGGELDIETLLTAYKNGIFPWPINDKILAWFAPPMRAVLFLEKFHISKTLKRELNRTKYTFSFNQHFKEVVEGCQELNNRAKQKSTWITREMARAYEELHKAGYARSVEVYDHGELVGGLYGVEIGKMFAGESMFFRKPNASKLALCMLVEYLKHNGSTWLDCQVMTPHMKHLGAEEIFREDFIVLLKNTLIQNS